MAQVDSNSAAGLDLPACFVLPVNVLVLRVPHFYDQARRTRYAAGFEAHLVAEAIGGRLPVSHIHFGGGTPTIMTPETFADFVVGLHEKRVP
ncbi:hypothetical protein PMN64_06720 [Bradyrhizobium sp. UFLA01-814]|uniref:hypothetical protein n=1 Tax=Bradyrhizobium sp. UFLA01-814 TaxID=3023480 RepID=UPI00398AB992